MEEKDINKINSLEQLSKMVDSSKEAITKYQEKKQYLDADAGTEYFRNDDEWVIAALHNKGAACELGKGTDWCTAAPGLDYFRDYYKPDDPLFYFKDVSSGDRFQLHFGQEEFMDENDEQISGIQLEKLYNLLIQTNASKKYKAALGNASKKIESNKLKEALYKAAFEDPDNPNMEEFKKIFNNHL